MTPAGMSEGFEIVLRGPEQQTEKLTVQCNRLIVGSGAHCEVRLPMEHSSVEHVELTIAGGRVHARARSFEPPPTISGSPFVQAYLEPDVWIGVGPFQILVTPISVLGTSQPPRPKRGTRTPFWFSVVIAAFALVAISFAKRGAAVTPGRSIEAPALWSAPVSSCPQTAPQQALAVARQRQTLAESKRERRSFQVRDGVAAVPLFETAAACYSSGGDADGAAAMSQAAAALRARVAEDYHAHQIRLDHTLLVQDSAAALHEVKVLRAFTEAVGGPYAAWLSDMDRKLQLELPKEHAP
jgi:hypothetical protein